MNNNSKVLDLISTRRYDTNTEEYFQGKVLMNIWIEGWDADCFDAILRDVIRIQLKFKLGRTK